MKFYQTLFAAAALFGSIVAAADLAITSYPATGIRAGESVTITYSAPNDDPVTFILRKGDPNALGTVGEITNTATGGTFTWTPENDIPAGSDYALEIRQGDSINYTGLFAIAGGAPAVPSVSAPATSQSAPASSASVSEVASSASAPASSDAPESSASSAPASESDVPTSSSFVPTITSNPITATQTTLSRTSVPNRTTESESESETEAESATSSVPSSIPSSVPSNAAGHLGSPVALIVGALALLMAH